MKPKAYRRAAAKPARKKAPSRTYSKPTYGTGSEYGGFDMYGKPSSASKNGPQAITQHLVDTLGEQATVSLVEAGYDNVEVIVTLIQTGDLKQFSRKIK